MSLWIELRCDACADEGVGALFVKAAGAEKTLRDMALEQGWRRRRLEGSDRPCDVCRKCLREKRTTTFGHDAGSEPPAGFRRVEGCQKCGGKTKAGFLTTSSRGLLCEKCV